MQAAIDKLKRHRERAIKQGSTPAAYAEQVGISPQRIGRLISGKESATPTLAEAVKLHQVCKIKPDLWLG